MFRRYVCVVGVLLTVLIAPMVNATVVAVLNSRNVTISVLDQARLKEMGSIPMGKQLYCLMSRPEEEESCGASSADGLILLDFATSQTQACIPAIPVPYQYAISPDQIFGKNNESTLTFKTGEDVQHFLPIRKQGHRFVSNGLASSVGMLDQIMREIVLNNESRNKVLGQHRLARHLGSP
ncbi:MAG: hypothetical protein V4805_13095 [Pseudomonadota bacterium]